MSSGYPGRTLCTSPKDIRPFFHRPTEQLISTCSLNTPCAPLCSWLTLRLAQLDSPRDPRASPRSRSQVYRSILSRRSTLQCINCTWNSERTLRAPRCYFVQLVCALRVLETAMVWSRARGHFGVREYHRIVHLEKNVIQPKPSTFSMDIAAPPVITTGIEEIC